MNVSEVMTREIRTIRPDDSLDQAARLMWENDCGCLPVVDQARHPVAMLTDRDVCMNAYTQGRRLTDLPVRGAMSTSLCSVRENEPLTRAERLMQEFQVRRLPVVDGEGRLAGLLSLMDLARAASGPAAGPAAGRRTEPRPDEVTATLAAVGKPHACLLPGGRPTRGKAPREVVIAH